jgi:hypothetical protein
MKREARTAAIRTSAKSRDLVEFVSFRPSPDHSAKPLVNRAKHRARRDGRSAPFGMTRPIRSSVIVLSPVGLDLLNERRR